MNGDIESRDEMASPPMTESRAFIDRAIRFLATRCGIMQFVSLGSGPPFANDIHDVAYNPDVGQEARVVYGDVDYDVPVEVSGGDQEGVALKGSFPMVGEGFPWLRRRKKRDSIETGLPLEVRDEPGGYPITGQVVDGV